MLKKVHSQRNSLIVLLQCWFMLKQYMLSVVTWNGGTNNILITVPTPQIVQLITASAAHFRLLCDDLLWCHKEIKIHSFNYFFSDLPGWGTHSMYKSSWVLVRVCCSSCWPVLCDARQHELWRWCSNTSHLSYSIFDALSFGKPGQAQEYSDPHGRRRGGESLDTTQ